MENRSYRIEVVSNRERLKSIGPLIRGAWSRHDDELGRQALGEFLIDTGTYGRSSIAMSLYRSSFASRARGKFTAFHGYGTLQQYLARVRLPGQDCERR